MAESSDELQRLIRRFRAAKLDRYPPLEDYADPRERALWVLWLAKGALRKPWLSSELISGVLRECFELAVMPRAVGPALREPVRQGWVEPKDEAGARRYRIMKPGKDHLQGSAKNTVRLIDPNKAFSSYKQLGEIFQSLRGLVRICDPYFDSKTLARLEEFPRTCQIRLLTVTVNRPGPTRNACKAYQKEIGNLEVRVRRQQDLHDRYIIHGGGMLLVGTSLNQIGAKQTFIVAVGPDMRRTMLADFDSKWAQAATFP